MKEISKEVRKNILLQIYNAKAGHPGGALSCADILIAIYFKLINEGDKVVLSKGHASAALYAVLAEKGFFSKDELLGFRKLGRNLQGHPSLKTTGVDAPSGSLGQGLSIANGMAISFKLDGKGNNVYCIMGDGEIQEGQIWEAAMSSAHYKLNNLIAFLDYNKLQIDGANADVMGVAPVDEKFKSFGWFVQEIDGHNFDEIITAVENAKSQDKPSIIIAHTTKGKGVSFMENQASWHGKAPNEDEYNKAIAEIGGEF